MNDLEHNLALNDFFEKNKIICILIDNLLPIFLVNCWPSDNGQGGCDVNIEYELEQDQLELQDVVITIPIP